MSGPSIAEWVAVAAMVVAAAGVLSAALVLARTRDLRLAVAVLLEFLTAAGLLRLTEATSVLPVLTAAGIILVRRVAIRGLSDPRTRARTGVVADG